MPNLPSATTLTKYTDEVFLETQRAVRYQDKLRAAREAAADDPILLDAIEWIAVLTLPGATPTTALQTWQRVHYPTRAD